MPIELDTDLLQYATPDELKALEKALQIELALSGPLAFARYVSEDTEEYKHVVYLDGLIVALVEHRLYKEGPGPQGIKNAEGVWVHPVTGARVLLKLMVSMPPRHGKSYLISEHTAPWFLARYPEKRVLLASYEADFAASWGVKARRHLEEHPEFGFILDPSSRSGSRWDILNHRGGMVTAGQGGPITGRGMHLGILDDPIKNAEDVMSQGERDKAEDWWHSTFHNRLEPDAVEMVVLTRWHEDDIGARLSEGEKDKWFVVNLPALAFEETNEAGISIDVERDDMPDPLGRLPGEALCPERYSATYLEELRDSPLAGGRLWFSAQYQGRPTIEDSGMFPKSHFRYYTREGNRYHLITDNGVEYVELKHCFRFITVDLAASSKTSADWTVFSCWDALPNNRLLLVDRFRDRIEAPEHYETLKAFVRDMQKQDDPKMRFVGVEKSTYGLSLIQVLVREPGFIVRELTPDKDKFSRAIPAGLAVKNHQVFFPKNAPWLPIWNAELTKFRAGAAKDDQVDTFSYAVDVWQSLPSLVTTPKFVPVTMQERVDAHLKSLDKPKKKRYIHAQLGRW